MKLTEQQLKLLLGSDRAAPTILDVRRDICAAAQQIVRQPVSFEERVFQALEVTTRGGRTPNAVHVWSSLSSTLPSITALYDALGISTDKWPGRPRKLDFDIYSPGSMEWDRTLRGLFMRGTKLTETGERVAQVGSVTVRDLVISILQSSRQIGRKPDRTLLTNLPFRYMAKRAGLLGSKYWSTPLDEFVKKAAEVFDRIYSIDPSYGGQQFVLYHDGKRARIRPFGLSGIYQLQEAPLPDGSLWIARGNVIQPATRFSERSIEELEELINGGEKEATFQRFFEQHPEFLLALGDYVNLHPQLILSEDSGSQLIPDFFLEKMDSGFCDICDLKRPTADLVRYQKNRHRFRDAVMEAIAQLTVYKDWFEERGHRDLFLERYGLKAFRPKVVIVIGRKMSFADDVKRLSLESELPKWVTLKTYDDVVSGARRWRTIFHAP